MFKYFFLTLTCFFCFQAFSGNCLIDLQSSGSFKIYVLKKSTRPNLMDMYPLRSDMPKQKMEKVMRGLKKECKFFQYMTREAQLALEGSIGGHVVKKPQKNK